MEKDIVAATQTTACIRCGKCMEVCPSRLMPAKLATLADRGAEEAFVKLDGMECVECGCCTFTCPAKKHLAQSIKTMRRTVMANRRKK